MVIKHTRLKEAIKHIKHIIILLLVEEQIAKERQIREQQAVKEQRIDEHIIEVGIKLKG